MINGIIISNNTTCTNIDIQSIYTIPLRFNHQCPFCIHISIITSPHRSMFACFQNIHSFVYARQSVVPESRAYQKVIFAFTVQATNDFTFVVACICIEFEDEMKNCREIGWNGMEWITLWFGFNSSEVPVKEHPISQMIVFVDTKASTKQRMLYMCVCVLCNVTPVCCAYPTASNLVPFEIFTMNLTKRWLYRLIFNVPCIWNAKWSSEMSIKWVLWVKFVFQFYNLKDSFDRTMLLFLS